MESDISGIYANIILDKEDSFRVISLEPGHDDAPLCVRLLNTALTDARPYEAVSYVWGDAKELASIQVSDEDGIQVSPMDITRNCHAALKSLRRSNFPRILWIDSICINQTLSTEKNHQLNLMARIYQKASQVIVYLGKGTRDTDVAMSYICELDQPSHYGNRNAIDKALSFAQDDRTAVNILFQHPWFYRVWVLQEVTFAQKAIVVCGDHEVGWESFKEFYHWNVSKRWVERLPFAVSYAVSPKWSMSYVPYGERLLKTLNDTRFCGSTDPRDKLYAILPLADRDHEQMGFKIEDQKQRWEYNEEELHELEIRQRPLKIQVDYNCSVKLVYTDLAIVLMRSVGLDLLTLVVNDPAIHGLPSWAPDWTTTSSYWVATKTQRLGKHKPFSGFPQVPPLREWGWKTLYPHLIDTWTTSEYTSVNNETSIQLHIRGVKIGKIEKLGLICDIAANCFPIGQWASMVPHESYLQNKDIPKHLSQEETWGWSHGPMSLSPFARTLVMDDVVYPRAVNDAITYIRRYNGEIIEKQEAETNSFGTPGGDGEERVPLAELFAYGASFEKQALWMLKHCDGKRLFILDNGSIGLAPDRAQVGDVVFVVEGASVPFVLRHLHSTRTGDQEQELPRSQPTNDSVDNLFSLVGEAFVLGAMEGEMWDVVNDGKAHTERIIVR